MMRLRSFRTTLVVAGGLLAAPASAQGPRPDTLDVLIVNGQLYDGSGGAPRRTAIGLRGNRIAFVGAVPRGTIAKRQIDADGLIVSPGFIDPHTHSFEGLPRLNAERRTNASALMQGITTVTIGPDGRGPYDVARIMTESEQLGIGVNAYVMVGFGTVRTTVMKQSAAPASPAQIDSMRALITKAMREGAYGVGSGLFYNPQSYAATDEVIAVVSAAKPFGGVYDTHQRDESSYTIGLLASVRETIRIGCESGLTANVGHIKTLGVDVWGKADSVLAIMAAARATGCTVTADQYPWTASGTGLSAALMPRWVQAGGRDSMMIRLGDPALKVKTLDEMRDNLRRRGGDSTLLLTSGSAAAKPYVGKTLKQVAAERGTAPVETALDMIMNGLDMSVASFNMTEADIETFMKDPWVMTSSDGSDGHPRLYGTYPRKIRRYVLDKPVITMQRLIQASSAQVAQVYGLVDRGVLRAGAFADVIVFDPQTIRDEATYVEPTRLSTGMRWVFVNGVAAVAEGAVTGALAGKGLTKRGTGLR
jgi:N-acyl-D-aspartate/D-glutamate deacylase